MKSFEKELKKIARVYALAFENKEAQKIAEQSFLDGCDVCMDLITNQEDHDQDEILIEQSKAKPKTN